METIPTHGDKALNNNILFIFNMFEMLIDGNDKKMMEHLDYDLSTFSNAGKIYNVTEGLQHAFATRSLTNSHFLERAQGIRNNNNLFFKHYVNKFQELKVDNLEDLCMFVESSITDIFHRKLSSGNTKGKIFTINNFEKEFNFSSIRTDVVEKIKGRTVVIVDNVLPSFLMQVIKDEANELYFIGPRELFLKNEEIFNSTFGNMSFIRKIDNFNLDTYFEDLVDFICVHNLIRQLRYCIRNQCHLTNFKEFSLAFQGRKAEMLKFMKFHKEKLIDLNLMPYFLAYIEKNRLEFPTNVHLIVHRFQLKYGRKLIDVLPDWNSVFSDCGINCVISPLFIAELGLNNEEEIDELFNYLSNNVQFSFSNGNFHYIDEIMKNIQSSLKQYFEVKLIEYILKKGNFSLFESISVTNTDFMLKVMQFCKNVTNDITVNDTFDEMPQLLQDILSEFKSEFQKKVNIEWGHVDGIHYCNNTVAPFNRNLSKMPKTEGQIQNFREIRPLISNEVAFFIERDRANIIDLFTYKKKNVFLNAEEVSSQFATYNSNLLITSAGEVNLLDKESKIRNLNVKVDEKVFNGIRIKDKHAYYFPSNQLFVKVPLDVFIDGEAAFYEKPYTIQSDQEMQNIVDLIVLNNDALWFNKDKLCHLDLVNSKLTLHEITCPSPRKLFYHEQDVYLLCETAIYVFENFQTLKWITDVDNWDNFTCFNGKLITSRLKDLTIIDLDTGRQQKELSLFESKVTDLIMTSNRLLVIEEQGVLNEITLENNTEKIFSIKIQEVLSIEGKQSRITFSNRVVGINNQMKFILFGA